MQTLGNTHIIFHYFQVPVQVVQPPIEAQAALMIDEVTSNQNSSICCVMQPFIHSCKHLETPKLFSIISRARGRLSSPLSRLRLPCWLTRWHPIKTVPSDARCIHTYTNTNTSKHSKLCPLFPGSGACCPASYRGRAASLPQLQHAWVLVEVPQDALLPHPGLALGDRIWLVIQTLIIECIHSKTKSNYAFKGFIHSRTKSK